VAPAAVQRLKTTLRRLLRQGRGRRLADTVQDLSLVLRGWVAYFRLAEVKASFEDVDKWLRRKLRCIIWRQWKRPRTRLRELCRRGLDVARARASASNGRGPWWNAGASHMHAAVGHVPSSGGNWIASVPEFLSPSSAWTLSSPRTDRAPSAASWKTRGRVSHSDHSRSSSSYVMAINSSCSLAAAVGVSSRVIDSALK
jgi:hypothetical protein